MTWEDMNPIWAAAAKEPDVPVTLPGGVEMLFRRVPAGWFRMGQRGGSPELFTTELRWSNEPAHRVRISRPFLLGKFPVTQQQFAVWTSATGGEHRNEFAGHPNHPAENLHWDQARRFCAWLTASERLPADLQAELPTEAQWEHACRAGTQTAYHSGDGAAALARVGWYGEEWGEGGTHEVGLMEPNALGLFDLHGNVWEWCLDAWDAAAYRRRLDGVQDPLVGDPDDSAALRVVRGGSWSFTARLCRSAYRVGGDPSLRNGIRGFRVALLPRSGASEEEKKAASGGVRG